MKEKSTKSFAISMLLMVVCQYAIAQYSYGVVAMGGTGYVSGIVTSRTQPDLVYCRTDVGGAYRWDATNKVWVPLLDWVSAANASYQGVTAIALDPNASNKVYIAVGNYGGNSAILQSNDYGATFSITNTTNQFKMYGNSIGRGNGEKLQVDPNNGNILFYGSNNNGLFKSTDAGVTWARVASLPILTTKNANGISLVLFDSTTGTPGNATQTIYVGVSTIDSTNNLYVSNDGGNSFNPMPTGGPNPRVSLPERAALASDGNLYITLDDQCGPGQETSGFIWKYNTAAGTWTNVSPATGIGLGGISIDPHNPQRVIASTANGFKAQYTTNGVITYGDRFYLTNNGGSTWQTIVPVSGYNNNNMVLNPNGIPWIAGQSIHWGTSIQFDPFRTDTAWVNSGNGIYRCNDLNSLANTNTVNTWNFMAQGVEESVPYDMISIPSGPVLTGIADYDGFQYTDVTQYAPSKYSPSLSKCTGIAFATQNTNFLVRVGNGVNYTTNQGASWTAPATTKGTYGRVAVSADGSVVLHCPTGSTTTWRTTNITSGATWTASTGMPVSQAVPWADPVNPLVFYVYSGGSPATFYKSTDGGVSFASTGASPGINGSTNIRTALGYTGHVWFAMGGLGLKYTTDGGSTFNTMAITGITNCSAVALGAANPSGATGTLNPSGPYLSIYIWATINGVTGVFGSSDQGVTWTRLNDDAHQYGGIGNGNFIYADNNVVGRYYFGTLGRGIPYGQPTATILPITLLSFYGSLISQNQSGLKWQTVNETNNSYFDVERSVDGKNFTKLGEVASLAINGNSSQLLNYAYQDDVSNLNGIVYYRLKQVDKDGKFTYSNIININIADIKTESVQVFPNPVSGNNINLKIQLATNQNVQVSITNIAGAVVYKGASVKLLAGSSSIKINQPATLAKGTYLVELVTATNHHVIGSSKIVIQ